MAVIPLPFLLQEGKVKGLQKSYETWMSDHTDAMQARDMETLVKVCHGLANETQRIWQETAADLHSEQPEDLEGLGRFLDGLFTRIGGLLANIKESVTAFAARTRHRIAGLEELEKATATLMDLHKRIVANWPWDNEPWPPLDRAMQQRSRQQQDGPGENIKDILRRLEAGQPF